MQGSFLLLAALATAATYLIFRDSPWSADTRVQYQEALSGRFTDHHPPAMAALWRPFVLASVGPAMILIQACLYWLIAYIWMTTAPVRLRRVAWIFAVTGAFLLPTSIAFVGIVWKDVHLALAWGLGWTLLLVRNWIPHRKGPLTCLAASLLLYGVVIRHNAFIAAPPLLLILATGRPWLRRIGSTLIAYLLLALACLALTNFVSYSLLGAHKVRTAQMSLMIFDSAGVTARTGRNAFPFAMSQEEVAQVSRCYDPDRWDYLYYRKSPCAWTMERMLSYEEKGGSVYGSWARMILNHPGPYMAHRLAHARRFFGAFVWGYRAYWAQEKADERQPALVRAYITYMDFGAKTRLIRPIFALVGCIAVWILALRLKRGERAVIAGAAISGILNLLSYIPFGVASDQRYAYPSFLLLALSVLGLILSWLTRSDRDETAGPGRGAQQLAR